MGAEFKPSFKPFSVGIELEVQVVDSGTGKFKEAPRSIVENLKTYGVQEEFLKSMLEIVSSPHSEPEGAVNEVWNTLSLLKNSLGSDFKVLCAGTHPFEVPENARYSDNERYQNLLKEFQQVLRQFLIFGLHIHVGVENERQALRVYNALVNYSPLFLAISVSSPLFSGKDTGILSYRTKIFEQLPRAGVPQQFRSYEEFVELFETLRTSGFVKTYKDVWWDVRIRPDLGTVEVRICDANPELERILAISKLCVYLAEKFSEEDIPLVFIHIVQQNKWNTARYGLKGKFVDFDGTVYSAGEKIREILKESNLTEFLKIVEKPTVAEKIQKLYPSFEEIVSLISV